jgi:hypothetical protein
MLDWFGTQLRIDVHGETNGQLKAHGPTSFSVSTRPPVIDSPPAAAIPAKLPIPPCGQHTWPVLVSSATITLCLDTTLFPQGVLRFARRRVRRVPRRRKRDQGLWSPCKLMSVEDSAPTPD